MRAEEDVPDSTAAEARPKNNSPAVSISSLVVRRLSRAGTTTRVDGPEARLATQKFERRHDHAKHEENQRVAVDGSGVVGTRLSFRWWDEARRADRNAEGSGSTAGC